MMQAAEPRHGDNFAARICSRRRDTPIRSLLVQAEVGSVLVVVANILVHQPLQVALVEHDHMVEQVAAAVAHEALCNAVLPRAFERSANGFYAKDFRRCQNLSAESGVAVVNQIARRGIVRKCLAQLLTYPGAGWMSSSH